MLPVYKLLYITDNTIIGNKSVNINIVVKVRLVSSRSSDMTFVVGVDNLKYTIVHIGSLDARWFSMIFETLKQ